MRAYENLFVSKLHLLTSNSQYQATAVYLLHVSSMTGHFLAYLFLVDMKKLLTHSIPIIIAGVEAEATRFSHVVK